MFKKTYVRVSFAVMASVVLGATMLSVASVPVHAATKIAQPTSSSPGVITTTTKGTLSQSACDTVKKLHPSLANSPDICTYTHIEKKLVVPSNSTSKVSVSPNGKIKPLTSCYWAGAVYFWDYYTDGVQPVPFWELEQDSQFYYNGNCSNPGEWTSGCYVDSTGWGYTVASGSLSCTQYTTNIPSTAALQMAYIYGPGQWYGYRVWQRRECYSNPDNCNWHTDQG